MLSTLPARAVGACLLAAILTFSVGCSNVVPRAVVKGKITIGGKNLTTGNVMFYGSAPGATGSASIDSNGNYTMMDAPVGDVKITVTVPKLSGEATMAMKKLKSDPRVQEMKTKMVDPTTGEKKFDSTGNMPATIVPIPEKYADPASSGLTYTVTQGEQTKDIPLTP